VARIDSLGIDGDERSGFSVDEINKTCTGHKIPDEMFKLADQALRNELAKNFKDEKPAASFVRPMFSARSMFSPSVRKAAVPPDRFTPV
jgi:hypothetical protein